MGMDDASQEVQGVQAGSIPSAHGGLVVWLTGLSGAGKTTLSNDLSQILRGQGIALLQLDGDQLRGGINADLGFGVADRSENIRRTALIADLAASQGLVVVCSLISPLEEQRDAARAYVKGDFTEVYVSCDLQTCILRDPKQLYARALKGEVANFTGVSARYEEPSKPDLIVQTDHLSREEAAGLLCGHVQERLSRLRQRS